MFSAMSALSSMINICNERISCLVLNFKSSQIVDRQNLPSKENKIQAKLCQVVLQPAQAAENNSHKLALQTAG
jgi:hypothetical protein